MAASVGDQDRADVEVHREFVVFPVDALDRGRAGMADMVPNEIKSAEGVVGAADDLAA